MRHDASELHAKGTENLRRNKAGAAGRLLRWYDTHARVLPWRVPPAACERGVPADPYRVWLSEIMLQQTTVASVEAYFRKFIARWPTVQALAAARDQDVMAAWAGLGYYARARNLLKCARRVSGELGGVFPPQEAELLQLPGIGPYTAAAVAAIAFDQHATVLDGNVERVMARLYNLHDPLPGSKDSLRHHASTLTPAQRPGDYAQAVMDLGATICTPRNPKCDLCPWHADCAARAAGTESELPRKAVKPARPTRRGVAYIARRKDSAVLLERRPNSGLLGGMLGWPGSDWAEATPEHLPPIEADWQDLTQEVRHTFTHFHLRLTVRVAVVPDDRTPRAGYFLALEAFDPGALPTVMRKVWRSASSANF
jgi:A/G-specific adenine glycosylase